MTCSGAEAGKDTEGSCLFCSFALVAQRNPSRRALLTAPSLHLLQGNTISPPRKEESPRGVEEEEEVIEEGKREEKEEENDEGKHGRLYHLSRPGRQKYPMGDRAFTYSNVLTLANELALCIRKALVHHLHLHLHLHLHPHPHPHHLHGNSISSSSSSTSSLKETVVGNVGILLGPSVEYVVAVLAVLQCGFAFVPLDPSLPSRRLADLIIDSDTCLVLACKQPPDMSSSSYGGRFRVRFWRVDPACVLAQDISSGSSKDCVYIPFLQVDLEQTPQTSLTSVENTIKPTISHVDQECTLVMEAKSIVGGTEFTKSPTAVNEVCHCFCHHMPSRTRTYCYIMYTSGSTTRPKGVCGTEAGLMHRLRWMQQEYPFRPDDITVFKTSIAFIDHLTELFGPLLGSSLVVVPPAEDILKNPLGLLHYLEVYHVTRLTTVPSWMRAVLPALQSRALNRTRLLSLCVVLLSGEVLMQWLLKAIRLILPNTLILNLYGSTEVSGDCFSFDCEPLESDWGYPSVPIGKPIPGCVCKVSSDENDLNEGELWIGGDLVASGYYNDGYRTMENFTVCVDDPEHTNMWFFKTGDYVKKLESGILVYLGRKDRTVRLNGHKVVLDEIESVLQMCPLVAQAAVTYEERRNLDQNIIAHIVVRSKNETNTARMVENSSVSESETSQAEANLRNWLGERLPFIAVPQYFDFLSSLPLLVSGKVDYQALSNSSISINTPITTSNIGETNSITIHAKHVFEHVLKMDNISVYDDFFSLGGTSVSAAHAAYILGVDMRAIYHYSSAVALEPILKAQQEYHSFAALDSVGKHKRLKMDYLPSLPSMSNPFTQVTDHLNSKRLVLNHGLMWPSLQVIEPLAFSRCNVHANYFQTIIKGRACKDILKSALDSLTVVWKVQLKACIDASPLLLISKHKCHLFIGSHAHNFACIDARSGSLIWERVLGGRVESSAGITLDLTQVVVGCYDGYLYFFDCENGALRWKFQTNAEIKCQPTPNMQKGLIWCGSHDHKLYILDAVDRSCVWEHDFKASIFAAPAHDSIRGLTYIATTGGAVIALTFESDSPKICWTYQCSAPVFGTPMIDADLGYAICTVVNGFVLALTSTGLLSWQYKTLGPIFAGACISPALPSQVLVCCRDGWVYSLNSSDGICLWKHQVGEPITSAAYVDEGVDLTVQENNGCVVHSFRLVCVCGSLGQLHVLKVYGGSRTSFANIQIGVHAFPEEQKAVEKVDLKENSVPQTHEIDKNMGFKACEHVAALKLPGDVFSSPLMLDGRIFIGCRDSNLYCLQVSEMSI